MSPADDPFAGLGGDGGPRVREPTFGWRPGSGRSAFWGVAATGTIVLCAAWFWYGLVYFDAMTEQGKALAAGSSQAGISLLLAGPPLILAHMVVLLSLLLVGMTFHSRRAVGASLALLAVVGASTLAIAVNELVWEGRLFTMYVA